MAMQRLPAAGLLLLMMTMISSSSASSEMKKEEAGTPGGDGRWKKAHLEAADAAGHRTYIVFLEAGVLTDDDDDAAYREWHQSFLPSENTSLGEPRLRHSYRSLFNGFSARLTKEELKEVSRKPGFIRAFPNVIRYPQTTHTPAFLGLPNSMGGPPDSLPGAGGRGMIIGIADTGIDIDHPSMNNHGFEDIKPPDHWKWKGYCQPGIQCNRKLIGAKNFVDPGYPPYDDLGGHGTHTASTAAGNIISGASLFGLASGNASGVAPYAHVAIYKVCNAYGCPDAALLGGIREAVMDGVDVLSLSVGAPVVATYDHDPISIASYLAMQRGVMVVACAGNHGPAASSVVNVAPWVLTVGASTVDRSFTASVKLVTPDESVEGESLVNRRVVPTYRRKPDDLLYRSDRPMCEYPAKEFHLLQDRILLCDDGLTPPVKTRLLMNKLLSRTNATAIVLIGREEDGYTIPLVQFGPYHRVVQMPYERGQTLKEVAEGPQPQGVVDYGDNTGTVLGTRPAPRVAGFSGRGPGNFTPGILKPDLVAPGVNILAAAAYPTGREHEYVLMSGTSMATPHVSGLAALLKKQYPTWTPAIIRSALMTTTNIEDNRGYRMRIMDETGNSTASHYAMGAGHVNLTRAMDPGLVYDLEEEEYARYVCTSLGDGALQTFTGNRTATCSGMDALHQTELNYPSVVGNLSSLAVRTFTNLVSDGLPEVYTWAVEMPLQVKVTVQPDVLKFTFLGQKLGYVVGFEPGMHYNPVEGAGSFEGFLTWSSSRHTVRTPLLAVVGLPPPMPSTAWDLSND